VTVTSTIQTSGGALNAGTVAAGRNAGSVTITGAGAVTAGAITANGNNGSGANQVGGNGGNVSVTSTASTVAVGAVSTIGGNGGTGNANGGNAGAITLDAGGATPSITLGGNLTATGGNQVGTGTAGSGGQIWLRDAALLNAGVTASAQGGGACVGAGANVRFDGTINSTGGARALTVNTNAATVFGGAVGGTSALASLTTNAGGTTSIGGSVTTTGVQTYNDAVTLTGNAVLTGTTPTFASTVVGGGNDLTLNFSGTTTVNGANFTGIRNLATGNAGATQLTGAITTSGTQTYNDAVTLTGATTLASSGNGAIAFNGTVNGAQTLAVNTTGATTFASAVGGTTALTSLTTNAGGTTSIGGSSVRTTGNQTYNDNVSLGAPTTFVTTANGSITANGGVAANGHLLTIAAGLGNVVMQNAANDLATVSVTSATNVALRDTNAIDFGTSTIGANLTVSAGGAVTDSGAISVAGATTINAGAANDVTLDNLNDFAGNVSVQSGRNVRLNDINSLTLDLSNISTLTATAVGTVTLAGQLTATGAGDAIIVSGSRFVNNAGAGALSASGGRWLVWSSNPNPFGGVTQDNRGGLAYDFKQYNATYGVTPVAQPTGNGFLYSIAPTITPGLTGTVSKAYDGSTAATLTAANFTATGAVDGDTVTLSGSGTYDNRNVGTAKTVTATAIAVSASNGAATVYGYQVNPTSASANTGVITAAPLTVTAQTDNRVYNGTTGSVIAPVLSGTTYDAVGTAATQTYDNRNVGTGKTLTAGGLVMNDGNGGANYAISYVADNTGVITAAVLSLSAVSDTKVFDGSTSSNGAAGTTGLIGGDTLSGLSQRFASKNVLGANGSTLQVNAGYVVSDGNGGANYTVTTNTAPGTITPARLVIAADDKSRPFGAPNPPFTASYAGFVAGETAAVLDGTLSFLTAATTSSAPGGYSITPFGQTSGNYVIAYVDGTLTVVATSVRPGGGGETAADMQAIGAQYTSRGMPDDVLTRIRYVFGDDECKDVSGTTGVPCAGGSVVRMVNGGILLPRQ